MMPSPHFEVDQAGFQAAIQRIIADGRKTAPEVVKQEAKLLVVSLVKHTPPMGQGIDSQSGESFGSGPIVQDITEQKLIGEQAITGDIRKAYHSARDWFAWDRIFGNKKTLRTFQTYFNSQRWGAIKTVMTRMHLKINIAARATKANHRALRNSRGRVASPGLMVLDMKSVEVLLAGLKFEVGKEKAGWKAAAAGLGLTLAGWISRHASPGGFENNLKTTDEPSITVANLVGYAQKHAHDPKVQILQKALRHREDSMNHRMDAALGEAFKGYR